MRYIPTLLSIFNEYEDDEMTGGVYVAITTEAQDIASALDLHRQRERFRSLLDVLHVVQFVISVSWTLEIWILLQYIVVSQVFGTDTTLPPISIWNADTAMKILPPIVFLASNLWIIQRLQTTLRRTFHAPTLPFPTRREDAVQWLWYGTSVVWFISVWLTLTTMVPFWQHLLAVARDKIGLSDWGNVLSYIFQ